VSGHYEDELYPGIHNEVCKWIMDEDGNWLTSCNNIFTFFDGTPKGNHFEFCPYCGQQLISAIDCTHGGMENRRHATVLSPVFRVLATVRNPGQSPELTDRPASE
jgi:hypothetical protein